MTLDREIPVVRASGSYYEVGRQIGEACSGAVGRAADLERAGVPRFGRSLDELLGQAALCRRMTAETYPFVLEELDGAAAGAGVPAEALFAASIEELWESRPSQNGRTEGRCTDVVVAPGATANGHLLVAHNNDLPAASEDDVVAIERDVPGDPLVFSIGIGPFISVGWNSAGLSLTGNEVSPNDERAGIPRLLLVRAQLRARTLEEAVAAGVHPLRASAYNSVLAHSSGAAVNVEASATAYGRWGPSERGTIVHTNHYVSPEMVAYEGAPLCAQVLAPVQPGTAAAGGPASQAGGRGVAHQDPLGPPERRRRHLSAHRGGRRGEDRLLVPGGRHGPPCAVRAGQPMPLPATVLPVRLSRLGGPALPTAGRGRCASCA